MARRLVSLEVLYTERLTPHMVRVVAGGSEIDKFPDNGFTDRYVKIVFPPPGVRYPEPLDVDAIRREFPRAAWPRLRTYTVRSFDAAVGELAIDFVLHGQSGIAGPWAAKARPGDRLHLLGPGGAYAPDPTAAWHLLVGDDTAIPAIGAALERIADGRPVHAIVQVDGPAGEQPLPGPDGLVLRWLHRADSPVGGVGQLLAAVRELAFPAGSVQAFVHGEAAEVREVRRHLLGERGVPRGALSVSGYWRRGRDEESFRDEKRAERERERAADGQLEIRR